MAQCTSQHSKLTPGPDTLRYSQPHLPRLLSAPIQRQEVCVRAVCVCVSQSPMTLSHQRFDILEMTEAKLPSKMSTNLPFLGLRWTTFRYTGADRSKMLE